MGPKKIVCLTEETVETLYLLGEQDRIAGISAFVERPEGAKKAHPVVTTFTHSNIKKIQEVEPDLVIGFSDIQKDIAKELVGAGLNVWVTNQRSLEEILESILNLCRLIGRGKDGDQLVESYRQKLSSIKEKFKNNHFTFYAEEWDEPTICGIRWFSELLEAFGGEDIFKDKSLNGSLAKDRFVTFEEVAKKNPDWFFACWCGKPVEMDAIKSRPGHDKINATKNNRIIELDPAIFLQPGPALFESGLDQIEQLLENSN